MTIRYTKYIKSRLFKYILLSPLADIYLNYLRKKQNAKTPILEANRVLKFESEIHESVSILRKLGLPLHSDIAKNWDHLIAFSQIIHTFDEEANVLDAGGELYSPLVVWLFAYGFDNLNVINLAFENDFNKASIMYQRGDITSTSYPNETFDVICSLSVIEHGVDFDGFLDECRRILKPGGLLLISTDFWNGNLHSEKIEAYNADWKPFNSKTLEQFLKTAVSFDFRHSELDLAIKNPVVNWKNRDFTFVICKLEM
jgi:SAM-dependent methyltransferase